MSFAKQITHYQIEINTDPLFCITAYIVLISKVNWWDLKSFKIFCLFDCTPNSKQRSLSSISI